jgi:hypothetical protein
MEAGTHSIWISEQLQELGHEVIVANVRELRAITHSDRKSARCREAGTFARLDPEILQPIAHRTMKAAGIPYVDPCTRPPRASAHGGCECRVPLDEVQRPTVGISRATLLC